MKQPLFIQNGRVERGTTAARTIGFPTANIPFEEPDLSGTYAGKVIVGDAEYRAAVYANQERQVLEAYLFDFSGNLYGKQITIMLFEKLADAERFRDSKDQKTFIEWAVSEVRKYFNREE
ncbi:MAG: riboflavin kinase [Candidatus Moraniibacteriota bacterium]